MACTLVPLAVLCLAAVGVMQAWTLKNDVGQIEAKWNKMQPQQQEASMVRSNLTISTKVVEEMTSWGNSRLAWHPQLEALQTLAPEEIQLTLFRSDHRVRLMNKLVPVRDFTVVIKGKAPGIAAKENVESMELSINDSECFKNLHQEARVTTFEADRSETAEDCDRIFEMAFKYKPKAFK